MCSAIPSFRSAALQPAEQQDLLPASVDPLENAFLIPLGNLPGSGGTRREKAGAGTISGTLL